MRNKRSRGTVFLFLLTFLASPASAQERIEWESVAGADHYLVEIREDGRLLFETQSEKAFIPLFLPPGDYDFQIKVVDAFGNIKFGGESSRLRISAPLIPFIVDVFPRIIHKNAEPLLFARVSGLLETEDQSTAFALENARGERLQLSWKTSDSTAEDWVEIALSTGKELPDAGAWHLIMANPDGREDRFEDALRISSGSGPRIISVSPRKFISGIPNAVLKIRARDFSGDAALLIDGPSEISIAKLNQGEEGVFEFSLNLKDASEGRYSISLVNPSGEIDTKTSRLRILSPKTASSGEPRPLSKHPNAIYGGWKPIIRLSDTGVAIPGTTFQPGYLGFSLGYSRDIENDLLRRLPYLDGLEWHLSASYAQMMVSIPRPIFIPDPTSPSELSITVIEPQRHDSLALLLGINYATWFDFPLNLLAQVGLGIGLTLREYTGLIPPSQFFTTDDPLLNELYYPKDSISLAISLDLGLRLDITPRLFVNATASAMTRTSISGYNEFSLQPKVEGGWRW